MAEGRLRAEWTQTAEVLSMLYNINRAPRSKPIPSWQFSPFGEPVKAPAPVPHEDAWETFKGLFDRGVFGGQRR